MGTCAERLVADAAIVADKPPSLSAGGAGEDPHLLSTASYGALKCTLNE
jgi:hypothetical protein